MSALDVPGCSDLFKGVTVTEMGPGLKLVEVLGWAVFI